MPILPSAYKIDLPTSSLSGRYGQKLLEDLGASVNGGLAARREHPAKAWADCGLMALTGDASGPPRVCPVPLPDCADAALDALRAITNTPILPNIRGAQLLTERAAITGHHRNGASSAGGHCRLLATRDGRVGLSLTRDEDWALLPAWLCEDAPRDWTGLGHRLRAHSTQTLVERGRLLGLAVVDAQVITNGACPWVNATVHKRGTPEARGSRRPRVLDLSSLWAGPLCSHLWLAAGAQVIKVEGSGRPDGARSGSREFFDLMNRHKQSVALDLNSAAGRQELTTLIQQADIVIEGSRPRALRQMGIIAEDMIASVPGLSWVSITGYGRAEPEANWIAYGDDAGVAAGLSAILREVTGQWLVCGDAIADPLTGLHAALAGWASWLAGGGHLVELSLAQTVRHCIGATAPADGDYRGRQARWTRYLEDNHIAAQSPQRRGGDAYQHTD